MGSEDQQRASVNHQFLSSPTPSSPNGMAGGVDFVLDSRSDRRRQRRQRVGPRFVEVKKWAAPIRCRHPPVHATSIAQRPGTPTPTWTPSADADRHVHRDTTGDKHADGDQYAHGNSDTHATPTATNTPTRTPTATNGCTSTDRNGYPTRPRRR